MVFSSNLFVFGFIPIFFFIYYIIPNRYRNGFIFIASLLFYEFGADTAVVILAGSIVFNYCAGRVLENASDGRTRNFILFFAVAINLGFLIYYKYTQFFWDVINAITNNALVNHHFVSPAIVLPIGISFFTFQAISYVTDIYSRHCMAARSLVDFGMYHSLFPQLIAGPIVRYSEIETRIAERNITIDAVSNGLSRFAIGLAKKVIIADHVGAIADSIFNLPIDKLSPSLAWLGAAAYTLQIYYDFSGYSDMAIGLGSMLGFNFPENFNQPYRSRNITEFWRRWHMTLSRWFRDYVYIPLGGNRKNIYRTYFNLFIVFFICGLWHGAGYTFLVWGLFQGALLMIERYVINKWNLIPNGIMGQVYTLLMLMIGWVFFRSTSLSEAITFLENMFSLTGNTSNSPHVYEVASTDQLFFLLVGAVLAIVPIKEYLPGQHTVMLAFRYAANLLLFVYAMALLSVHTFNPFLYFRF